MNTKAQATDALTPEAVRLLQQGLRLQEKGRYAEAERRYNKILRQHPDHAQIVHIAGILHYKAGNLEAASQLMHRAVELDPQCWSYQKDLGVLFLALEKTDKAEHRAREALYHTRDDQERAQALVFLAQVCIKTEKWQEAKRIAGELLALHHEEDKAHQVLLSVAKASGNLKDVEKTANAVEKAFPDDALMLLDAANTLHHCQHHPKAVALYEKVIALDRSCITAYANMAFSLIRLEQYQKARTILTKILNRDRSFKEIFLALAEVAYTERNYQEVIDICDDLLTEKPDCAEAWNMIGRALDSCTEYENALLAYTKATELDPSMAEAYVNIGSAMQSLGHADKALDCYHLALSKKPEMDKAYWNLSLSLLSLGRLEEGWSLFDYGLSAKIRTPYRPFPGFMWNGKIPLADKTFMVWREQGVGDDLKFSSVYGDLIAQAGNVIIETDPRLVPLYQRTWPRATVRAETPDCTGLGTMKQPDFDLTAPAGTVASHLRRSLDRFPDKGGHLIPDPERVAAFRTWLDSLGPGTKTGFSWRSSLMWATRRIFYTMPADWLDLLRTPGTTFINLQYDGAVDELQQLRDEHGITVHQPEGLDLYNDLDGLAALITALDCVVSAGTSIGDLAGAVGTRVFIYAVANHPHQLGAPHFPWFPEMRFYGIHPQQTGSRDFIAQITKDAQNHIAASGEPSPVASSPIKESVA